MHIDKLEYAAGLGAERQRLVKLYDELRSDKLPGSDYARVADAKIGRPYGNDTMVLSELRASQITKASIEDALTGTICQLIASRVVAIETELQGLGVTVGGKA